MRAFAADIALAVGVGGVGIEAARAVVVAAATLSAAHDEQKIKLKKEKKKSPSRALRTCWRIITIIIVINALGVLQRLAGRSHGRFSRDPVCRLAGVVRLGIGAGSSRGHIRRQPIYRLAGAVRLGTGAVSGPTARQRRRRRAVDAACRIVGLLPARRR